MKRFRLAFWIIGFGWFPMMFVTAASNSWSREYGFALIMATFIICLVGGFILMTVPLDHIFKKGEVLDEEIAKWRKTNLDYDRWIEAVKREAVSKAGLKFTDIQKGHDKLVEKNWIG